MGIPNYEAFMRPLLETLALGRTTVTTAASTVADKLALTTAERNNKPSWAHEPMVVARTRVAAEWLAAAKLLRREGDILELEHRGEALLSEKPAHIDRQALRRYPEFEAYLQAHLARQGA